LEVKGSFTLTFDFRYYRNYASFGYIVRLIANNSSNFDFISKTPSLQDNDIEFIAGSSNTNIHYNLNNVITDSVRDWIHSVIHFDLGANTISINLNGVVKTDTFNIKGIRDIRIIFGANNYSHFSTSDVPPVIVKDIRFETHGKNKRYWKLDQYDQMPVKDIERRDEASVINPIWVVDDHSRWKLKYTINTKQFPQLAFNGQDSRMYIVEEDQLRVVDLITDSVSTIKYKYGRPLMSQSNQLIYNPLKNELWQYIINRPGIAKYNFETHSWSNTEQSNSEPAYWHHNKFFSPVDNRLMTFGGYGFYRYKNQVYAYNEISVSWEEIETTGFIKPRYLSALGYSNKHDEVLIFGGYGNESGKQELSPESLYDLYTLNLKTFRFKKLWELNNVNVSFALGNSLIADPAKDCFYALCYPVHKYSTRLFLARFGISNPEMTVISDSIPYFFQDTESFCDLYYSAVTKELISITSRYLDNNQSEVSIYSLSFPPVYTGGEELKESAVSFSKIIRILICSIAIFAVVAFTLILFKKLKVFRSAGKKRLTPIDQAGSVSDISDSEKDSLSEYNDILITEKSSDTYRKSSIQFLGGFQVIDKNSRDITGMFTPTLKQIFVMILLASGEGGKGVSSLLLKDNIWFRKTKESARNIRGVYFRKLRMVLDEIGDVKLINSNNSWTISLGKDIDYDYGRVMNLIFNIRQTTDIVHEYFRDLILIGSKGPLLPGMEFDWLDKHKADYSNKIIDVLLDFSKKLDFQKDIKLIIQIADSVFVNDPLNEDALQLKCKVLSNNGKHSLAKNVYESFAREYFNSMGSNFDRQFNDLVN
jgi:two-component SAPR family response regulator